MMLGSAMNTYEQGCKLYPIICVSAEEMEQSIIKKCAVQILWCMVSFLCQVGRWIIAVNGSWAVGHNSQINNKH